MKKNLKQTLAKALAGVMVFGLVATAVPANSADAATKPKLSAKKVTVTVKKTKTLKVTGKKIKKTAWSVKSKKIATLSSKKKASVKIKGVKAGKTTVTAKVTIGKKSYKLNCAVTVKKAAVPTKAPTPATTAPVAPTATPVVTVAPTATPANTAKPTATPVNVVNGATVDESQTYNVPITSLNETTFTSDNKRPEGAETVKDDTEFKNGAVTFVSKSDYNSGVSFYINPCTSEADVVDAPERGDGGFKKYEGGTKDMFDYDYIRVRLTSDNEMNCRTYEGNNALNTQGFPGTNTSETYEGGWSCEFSSYMENTGGTGQSVKDGYATRTVFISLASLIEKGCNPAELTAIALCPQSKGMEITISAIDFVKVERTNKVASINVTAKKAELGNGKATTCAAAVLPANATRKTVKWTSSDETLATVKAHSGAVTTAASGSGTVTITATATDGSGVSGSVDITVGTVVTPTNPPADANAPVADANGNLSFVLASDKIVAKTNTGEGPAITDNSSKDANGIKYTGAYTMLMLDISAYLEEYDIDLSEFTGIEINGNFYDVENEVVECAAGKVKTALVSAADLNGYSGSMLTTGQYKNFPTISLDLKDADLSKLAAAAGFNFQIASDWEDFANYSYVVISSIKLIAPEKPVDLYAPVVDENGNLSFALGSDKIVAKTNTGEGPAITDNSSKDENGIKYTGAYTMLMLDISAYLDEYDIDLSEYAGIEINGNFYDVENEVVECAAGKVKTALVAAADLNGYAGSMLTTGQYKNFPTISLDLKDADLSKLAAAAGFNFQVASDWEDFANYSYAVISSIKLIAPEKPVDPVDQYAPTADESGNLTFALASDKIVAKTNTGEGPAITENSSKDENGIKYTGAYTMLMLDISAYLDEYEIDLSDYTGIEINGNFYDVENEVVECEAGKVKTALVAAADLNGYAGSMLTTGQYKNFPIISLDLTDADLGKLAGAAGFNFQIASDWEDFANYSYVVISSIRLVK